MKPQVLLLFPPPSDPAQPYSSLPALAAYLRLHGCQVAMSDLNIQAIHHLLDSRHLQECANRVEVWMEQAGAKSVLTTHEAEQFLSCAAAIGFADSVTSVSNAIADLRRAETYQSADRFVPVISQIDRALQLVSAAYYPAAISRHHFDAGSDVSHPETLKQVVEDRAGTLLSDWLRRQVELLIEQVAPDVVGISLVYPDQLVHALTIASAVREVNPSIHVCLGGPTVSRLAPYLTRLGPLTEVFDSAVIGEGEEALLELAWCVAEKRSLSRIPNLVLTRANGSLETGSPMRRNSLDWLPTPDYDGLDLSLYLAPEPVLLLNSSRGCYWGRCLFCDVSANASEGYRQRSMQRVIDDVRILQAGTGTRHLMFGDQAISPARLEALANKLQEHKLDVHWLCQSRLEDGLTERLLQQLAQAGCRGLVFGLESATQRTLDRMQKGTRAENAKRILSACAAAGISVNLQAFIGFPGESEQEALATESFITSQRDSITTASLTSFKLIEGTRAFRHSSALGIHSLRQDSARPGTAWEFRVNDGLGPTEASELAREMGAHLRAAFPVLEKGLSWNAYALLLVSRQGPDGLRLKPPAPISALANLQLRPGLKLVRLPYHVGKLAALVQRAARDQASESYEVASQQPTWTVLDRDNGRLVPLDDSSSELVRSCLGKAGVNAEHPATPDWPHRARLLRLVELGLVAELPARTPFGGTGR